MICRPICPSSGVRAAKLLLCVTRGTPDLTGVQCKDWWEETARPSLMEDQVARVGAAPSTVGLPGDRATGRVTLQLRGGLTECGVALWEQWGQGGVDEDRWATGATSCVSLSSSEFREC